MSTITPMIEPTAAPPAPAPEAAPAKVKAPKAKAPKVEAPEPKDEGPPGNIRPASEVGETKAKIAQIRQQQQQRSQADPNLRPSPGAVGFPKPPAETPRVVVDAEPEAEPEADDAPESTIGDDTLLRAVRAGLDMDDVRGMSEKAIAKVLARIEAGPAPTPPPAPKADAAPVFDLSEFGDVDPDFAKAIGNVFGKLQTKIEALESQVSNKGFSDPVERFAAEHASEYDFLLGKGTDGESGNTVNRNAVRDHLRLLTAGRQAAGLPVPQDVSSLVKQAVHAVHAEAILRHHQSRTSDRLRARSGQFIGHSKAGSSDRDAAALSPRERAIRKVTGQLRSYGV